MLSIACVAILSIGPHGHLIAVVHGRTSHVGFVAGTVSGVVDGAGSGHLGVAGGLGLAVPLPEGSAASAGGVVVGRAGSELLLLAVVADEEKLNGGGDEEEEDVEDRHGKAGGVQAANIAPVAGARSVLTAQARAKGRVDDALARVGTMARVVGDGGETSDKAQIEKDGEEGEGGDAAEAESQDDAEHCVQDCTARHALDRLFPSGNVHVLVGQDGEEVAVDAEDDGRAREFQHAQASLAEAQEGTTKSHGDNWTMLDGM